MDAFAFLANKSPRLERFYAVVGDEDFLKRQVIHRLKHLALGDDLDESAVSNYPGVGTAFSSVWDDLTSLPFFAPKRVVIVDAADVPVRNATPFLSQNRALLEVKVTTDAFPETGVFILDLKSLPSNTKLAKLINANSVIQCKAPAGHALPQWACQWAASQQGKQMSLAAGQLLVEYVGTEMGLLDQEILKLATYVGDRKTISPDDVDKLVGNNRAADTWKIFGLIGEGDTRSALRTLQRLLEQGEEPMRLLGAFGSQMRKLAQATRLTTLQGGSLGPALAAAGIPPFAVKSAEAQLRRMGRKQASKLYDLLLELHLDLRGNSPLSEVTLFERFLLKLAAKAP